MDLKCILVEALDDLAFSRSTPARRSRALDALERVFADICVSRGGCAYADLDKFLRLQDGFECNIASRLMYSISALSSNLQQTANSANIDVSADLEVSTTLRIIIQSLSILQGIALLHSSSKAFLGKKWCLQTFVDLLTVSRHLCPTPLSTSTNTLPSGGTFRSGTAPNLASSAIDTLLCVLVDSPPALRAFEEEDGVEVVVKTLKRTGVARDIRIKCLEFLYFYLLDETGQVALTTALNHKSPHLLSAIPDGPRIAIPFPPTSVESTSHSRSPSPDSCPRTPRKVPRNLGMLRKDVDFVPMTPKKVQVSRLGVGTPRTGPGRTPHRASSPTKIGRRSPVDISITLSSPTKTQLGPESSFAELSPSLNQGERRKSTQEKKEILGSLLGNVEALVESVSKSGIWGLG